MKLLNVETCDQVVGGARTNQDNQDLQSWLDSIERLNNHRYNFPNLPVGGGGGGWKDSGVEFLNAY